MKHSAIFLKLTAALCVLLTVIASLSACSQGASVITADTAAGTAEISFKGASEEKNEEILSLIKDTIEKAELSLSAENETSELYALNSEKLLYASEYFLRVLTSAINIGNLSDKAFNITMGEVTALWGFGTDTPRVPDKQALSKALEGIGLSKISITVPSNRVVIPSDLSIDLSGAKSGAALDTVYDNVRLYDTKFTLRLGSTVLIYGTAERQKSETVEIRNPLDDGIIAKITPVANPDINAVFVSYSDVSENAFEENGSTYHSFLAPSTGYPAENNLLSVTVVSSSGLNADALADACMISGFSEKTLNYLSYFGAEAVFVFNDGTVYATDGLADTIKITDKSFTLTTEEK